MSQIGKSVETKQVSDCWGVRGGQKWGGAAKGKQAYLGGDGNVLKLKSGDGCRTVNIVKPTELYTSKGYI